MSEPLTVEELKIKIAGIDDALERVSGKPSEWSLDTGQASQRIREQKIKSLMDLREYYKRLLDSKTKKAKWGEVNRF